MQDVLRRLVKDSHTVKVVYSRGGWLDVNTLNDVVKALRFKIVEAKSFVGTARQAGFRLYTGVPCSYVKPFINFVIDAQATGARRTRAVAPPFLITSAQRRTKSDAVAIATGAELGGKRAITMMQNSGLGNAVSLLTSAERSSASPSLLIVTLRERSRAARRTSRSTS